MNGEIASRIVDILDMPDVEVSVTDQTIWIGPRRHCSLGFVLKWTHDHFSGYFSDHKGIVTRRVLVIQNVEDAELFAMAFRMLAGLRTSKGGQA